MTTTLVKRPARIQPPEVPTDQITIADPPSQQQAPPPVTGMTMIMMPMMSAAGSVIVSLTNPGNKIAQIGSMIVLLGSVCVGLVMIIAQRTGPKRLLREGRERYLDYIEDLRHALRDIIAAQRESGRWRHPAPARLSQVCRSAERRWERRSSNSDFLVLRLGIGDQKIAAALAMGADTGPLNQFDQVCLEAAKNLQDRYAVLRDEPVAVDLRPISVLSIVGDVETRSRLARAAVAQLVSFHAPSDVHLAVVRADERADAWEWAKWLPHCQAAGVMDGDMTARLVTATVPALTELLEPEIERRLDDRSRSRGRGVAARDHLVVVIDGAGLPQVSGLEPPDSNVRLAELGIHVIALVDDQRREPENVDDRIVVDENGTARQASREAPFACDEVSESQLAVLARQLSPLRLSAEDHSGDEVLQDTVGLAEILGVPDAATLDPRQTWHRRALRDVLRVPIGIGANGGVVLLDLKESAHGGMGPHGMVVGATGSGKSEMLRTLVSSLVIGHGPDQLALMLVDFKGGATFAAMEEIPHLAGMITNLQDDLTLVDRMRDALYGEMQRRQEVLKAAGNLPNVTAYQDLIAAGQDLEPLPHLLVIIDEFSELLTAKPDFAELFVAIGRIGRSIGVHLLLATQKLEMGKIKGLESHLSYRISLRTFSESESRDAIGVPDAYHLPPEPGSGYLKVDTTVFERFKAALVSSPYSPPTEGPKAEVPAVPYVAVNGLGSWIAQVNADQLAAAEEDDTADRPSARNETSVLDVLCERLCSVGAPKVRPVWLDPLPEVLPLGLLQDQHDVADPTTCVALLGTVDDPSHQKQFPLAYDFDGSGANLVVAGAPQTGKSTLLRTMICSLALRYRPRDVTFYCIDYGGGTLRALEELPHVAAVATRVDPERISRTVNDVRTLLDQREEVFREHGVDTMVEFRRARAEGRIPADVPGDIFLVVDGWGTFREEYDDLDYAIADMAARGTNFGVHFIVTVTQNMQVRMRMQASMGGRLELRLQDRYDSEFDRKLMEQIGTDAKGRGLTAVGGNLMFQTAVPRMDTEASTEDLSEAQADVIATVREKWPDSAVEKVEVLPRLVSYTSLPEPEPGETELTVGISELNLGPVAIDLYGGDPHLQVYGDGETGKSNMLKVIARGLMQTRSPDDIAIALVDYRRSLLDFVPEDYLLSYATTEQHTQQMAQEIAQALEERRPGPDVTSEQLRNRTWWEGLEVFVLVDDYDLVVTSSGNPLLPLLDALPQGRDLGFHLVLARRTGGMSRAVFEPMIQRLIDLSTPGFMFSGDRMEGRLIGGVPSQRLPVGRAIYVGRDGSASLVQTAHVEDEDT